MKSALMIFFAFITYVVFIREFPICFYIKKKSNISY